MFRQTTGPDLDGRSEGGTRHLFKLDSFEFFDTLGEADELHHFVVEHHEEEDSDVYETDQATMYEFMARYLAGEYEKREFKLQHSPAHGALLDALELAMARARAGESEFSLDELEEIDFDFESEEAEGEER
jgi:hypothetical protein